MPSWNRVVGRGPTNEVEQELSDIYNKHAKSVWVPAWKEAEDVINPTSPPDFRKTTLMPPPVSSDTEEPPWDYLHRVVPELRGRGNKVQVGPNTGVLNVLEKSGFGPEEYPTTNLLGLMDVNTNDISLNPRLLDEKPHWLDATTAHEMGHTVGIRHGREMNNIEGLMTMAREAQRMKRNNGIASYDMKGMGGNNTLNVEEYFEAIMRKAKEAHESRMRKKGRK